MKFCNRCKLEKPLSDFFPNSKRKDGVQTYCKPCHLEYSRERYANPESYRRRRMNREVYKEKRKESSRKWYLKSMYGLTLDEYDILLQENNGGCHICGLQKDYWLHVDHDHACCPSDKSCGKCVRGLLCYSCNVLLGNAGDSPELLRKAISYLEDK